MATNWKKRVHGEIAREEAFDFKSSQPGFVQYRPDLPREKLIAVMDFQNGALLDGHGKLLKIALQDRRAGPPLRQLHARGARLG
jgi:hypothetical protein